MDLLELGRSAAFLLAGGDAGVLFQVVGEGRVGERELFEEPEDTLGLRVLGRGEWVSEWE